MMSSPNPSQTSLFGIELADVWASLTRPWRKLHRSDGLAWLAPQVQVRLIQADGRESVWEGDRQITGAPAGSVPFVAVEVPEDLYLRRSLSLPPMEAADLENAVALDVQSASPFGTQDLVWGYTARPIGGQQVVDMVFASRRQIGQYLDKVRARLPEGAMPEVWVRAEAGDPIILRGYGEDARARYAASRWKVGVALLMLAAGLATAVAVTPTAQLRLRAIQASQAHDEAVRRAQPLLAKREKMVQAGTDMAALNKLIAQRVDAAYAIDYLTRIIPDDTYLISLNLHGNKAVLIGQTANAAALMQRLSGEPGLRDVRAPSPAIRPLGSAKETFTVEFTFDARPATSAADPGAVTSPAQVLAAPAARVDTAGATAAAPQPPPQSPATPAAVPQMPAGPPVTAPAAPPAAVAANPFVIGGTIKPKAAVPPASAARGAP
jgi:general secretion pathway protein L